MQVSKTVRAQIQQAVYTGYLQNRLDEVEKTLHAAYRDNDEHYDKRGLVNSWVQLYRLCPPGTQIACVYIRSNRDTDGNTSRVWKVFGVYNNKEVAMLTGYMLHIGIGRASRSTNDYELITTSTADELAQALSTALYGVDNKLTARIY